MKKDMAVLLWLTSFLMTSTVSCELITFNAALNRPAFQSSLYHHDRFGIFTPSLANDGNYETHAYRGSRPQCVHSNRETNPWWAVDIGHPTAVYRVDFTNRRDNYASRSDNFIVGLTNINPNISRPRLWNYTLCGQYPGAVPAGATVYLYCQDNLPPFRYVIVQFPTTDSMNFCEIEVFVVVPNPKYHNVARGKPAFQVSTYRDGYGRHLARLANDGSRQTNYAVTVNGCAASQHETNPWWAVDLVDPTIVYFVNLTNSGDVNAYRSDNFVVGLTYNNPRNRAPVRGKYTLCGQYPGAVPAGATVTVHCTNVYNTRLRYRYVIVQFPLIDDLMNVCEIEVFTLDLSNTTALLQSNVAQSLTTPVTCMTEQPTGENDAVSCNPVIIVSVSAVAGFLLIIAMILVIVVCKQRTDNKHLHQDMLKRQ